MAMERHLPDVVKEQWTAQKLAKVAGVRHDTAADFLRRRADKVERLNDKAILGISSSAAATFHRAALRQLRRLDELEEKEKWTKADYALEKHAIACLGPLIKWCAMSVSDNTNEQTTKPQLSDGL
jgi:hypothetical protein